MFFPTYLLDPLFHTTFLVPIIVSYFYGGLGFGFKMSSLNLFLHWGISCLKVCFIGETLYSSN